MSNQRDVIVVGGGFAGLLVACEVARRGGRPLLLEGEAAAGGVALAQSDDRYSLEPAAGSFLLPNAHLSPILAAAGVDVEKASEASKRRYVYDRRVLFELEGPRALATRLVSVRAKARMLREPWASPPAGQSDESLKAFFERRFGSEVGNLASTLMAHGVFAGDPELLSARAAFPGIVGLEDSAGSIVRGGLAKRKSRVKGVSRPSVHIASGGMAALAAELAEYLGDDFRPNWKVQSVEPDGASWLVKGPETLRASTVIVALPPKAAAHVVPEPLATVLSEAEVAPVAVIGLGGKDVDVPALPGFGALIGPNSDLHVLGLLFESSYAPGRTPARHGLLKAIYGGAADPEVLALSDDELVELAISEASEILGEVLQPTWTRVVRHEPGIPQYPIGHEGWLDRLDGVSSLLPSLHLAGWGYRGIGLSALAKDAVRLADLLVSDCS